MQAKGLSLSPRVLQGRPHSTIAKYAQMRGMPLLTEPWTRCPARIDDVRPQIGSETVLFWPTWAIWPCMLNSTLG